MGAQSPNNNPNPQEQDFNQTGYERFEDVNDINAIFGGNFSSFDSNGQVKAVSDVFKAIRESKSDEAVIKGVTVVPVGIDETGNFGAVAIAKTMADSLGTITYIYTLLIEKSKESPIITQPTTINGVTIEPFIGVADAYKPSYYNTVVRAVGRSLNNKDIKTVQAGHAIIYDITDISEEGLTPLFVQALKSIIHAIDLGREKRDIFTLDKVMNNRNIRIASRVTLDQEVRSANGLPVRSDIKTELFFTEHRSASPTDVGDTRESSVVRISSYTDLIYTPQSNQQPMINPYTGAPIIQPSYVPRIMITNWEAKYPISNTEFMLLAVASLTSIIRNRGFAVSWRSHYDGQQNQLRNLGAVGLQVPGLTEDGKPGRIDTSNTHDLTDLMQKVLQPNPVITMAIPQGGAGDWSIDLIGMAGEGGEQGAFATKALFTAADNLTGGRTSKIYQRITGGAPLVAVESRGEMGYVGYQYRDGKLVDINETDLLAILNTIGEKDKQTVEEYLLALYGHDHIRIRMDRLKRILERLGKDVHIKAYTRKYNFNANFVAALAQAIADCGLTINNSSLLNGPERNVYEQTIQDWQSAMINPNQVNPLFQQQVTQNQAQYGFANPYAYGPYGYQG